MSLFYESYPALVASAVLLGVAGSSFAAGVQFVETRFPVRSQGFALGVYGLAVSGTVAAALFAPRLEERYGLSTVFLVLAAASAIACVTFAVLTTETPEIAPSREPKKSLPELAKSPHLVPPAIFYAVAFGGFIACYAYLPTLLVSATGVTPTIAATWAAAFAAVAVGARVAGGTVSDRSGPGPVLLLSFAMIVIATVGLAAGERHDSALLVVFAMLGVAFGAAAGATMKLLAERSGAGAGGAAGLVGAAGGFGGFVPPLILATMANGNDGYALPFLGLGIVAACCLAIVWRTVPRATAGSVVDQEVSPELMAERA